MSAFICSPKTYSIIYTGLSRLGTNDNQFSGLTHCLDYSILHRNGYETPDAPTIPLEAFMALLLTLNTEAVTARYGAKHGFPLPTPEELITKTNITPSPIQLLRSLQSLRYQCSEGNVTGTQGYKDLATLISALAQDIVRSLPEYETSAWDYKKK